MILRSLLCVVFVFAARGQEWPYYGGDRIGSNLFGDSLVALDAVTGKRFWHFQTVHHNIWDYDLPAQPTLVSVHRNGTVIPAVAQVTKTGFTFVFDRVTGKPLFDVEERKVPAKHEGGRVDRRDSRVESVL